ncbi:hypothetical protein [Algiphilus sp.]|uniref:OmpP1/FadL family transporter n=1 Tax=Algiphilus sp. TaxID=1872431 RepID=UPI0025BD9C7C|nr:hypothetical protein [Algiphilus sp.]MCK5768974.1 hypothetical protein [Algiphilus sp.]
MKRPRWSWLAVAMMVTVTPATATNGYFAHGHGASQRAMGGAGTAMAEDAFAVTGNPAAGVWVGDALDATFTLLVPVRDYSATARGEGAGPGLFTIGQVDGLRSRRERFYVPGVAFARRAGRAHAWGLAVYANGLNTVYPGNAARFAKRIPLLTAECEGTFGGGAPVVGGPPDVAGLCGNDSPLTGVDLAQVLVVPHYSRRLGRRWSLGISPVLAVQRFEAKGLSAFAAFSNAPGQVSDRDMEYSFGGGVRVGVFGLPVDWLALGASFQSRIDMQPFDAYAGLFPEQGAFDIPSTWNVGFALLLPGRQRLALDFQRIGYRDVPIFRNGVEPEAFVNGCLLPRLLAAQTGGLLGDGGPSRSCLGGDGGPGFGWRNVGVLKVGYQVVLGSFVLRAGYSRSDTPIVPEHVLFNIVAPGVPDEHFTAGFSFRMSSALSVDVAAMYAPANPVRGPNPLSHVDAGLVRILGGAALPGLTEGDAIYGADPQDQEVEVDMYQLELTVGIGYRF